MDNSITMAILAGSFYIGFIILYVFFKVKNSKTKRPPGITYRNLYVGQGSNTYVYGLNEYPTQELAKHNQRCPPGYRWHSSISSRKWA